VRESEKRFLTYLACAYSHDDAMVKEERFKLASRVAARLIKEGKMVFSPISHFHPMEVYGGLPGGWDFWERIDGEYISRSKEMFVLMSDGWRHSVGLWAEVSMAEKFGIPVTYINPKPEDMAKEEKHLDIDSDK